VFLPCTGTGQAGLLVEHIVVDGGSNAAVTDYTVVRVPLVFCGQAGLLAEYVVELVCAGCHDNAHKAPAVHHHAPLT
jgi:hypothetical protein